MGGEDLHWGGSNFFSHEQQLLETVSGSVVFQYVEEGNTGTKNSEYYDNLNSWVGTAWRGSELEWIFMFWSYFYYSEC